MNRQKLLKSLSSIFLIACVLCFGPIRPSEATQPNIIHIIADDFGWTDLSSDLTNKGNGSAFYQTPHIDRIASEGMAFTSAYALQTCVPTRVAVMTGQYATRTGVYNVTSIEGNANSPLVGAANNTTIDTASTTIGETLQGAGYTTAHFGKFHVTRRVNDITASHGFDYDFGGSRSGGPGTYFASLAGEFDATIGAGLDPYAAPYTQAYIDEQLKPYANGADVDSLLGTAKHLTDATTDAAIDFIGDRLSSGEPFYMNLAYNAVHTPIEPRPDLEAKYDAILASNGGLSPDTRHDSAAYAGLIEGADQSIGRLLDYLVDPNGDGDGSDSIAENTYVFFYGDNGGTTQVTDNTPLRAGKGSQYEGGLRVPLAVWAPGRVAAGSSSDTPIHSVDFYPTFAELAGAAVPDAAAQPLDGVSLGGVLSGQTSELARDGVYFHLPGYQGQATPTSTRVLSAGANRHKLMYFYEDRSFEFYDLNADLGEANNLADGDLSPNEYKLAARATVQLRDWLDETGALYPTVRADGDAVPPPQHLPQIAMDLGAELGGQTTGVVSKLGVSMRLNAVGDNAEFTFDADGIGIASDLDTGGPDQRGRINGSLAESEAIQIAFDTEVLLKSLTLDSLNTGGSESVLIRFVSGDNPFVGLDGYDSDGFTLGPDSLTFDGLGVDASAFTLAFGVLGQDEILLTADTVLSITSNPAVGGGFLLVGVAVAEPLAAAARIALDYNLDGAIDGGDYTTWRETYGSTTDLRADGNGDGVVNAADYALWRDNALPDATTAIPEPTTLTLALLAAFALASSRGTGDTRG